MTARDLEGALYDLGEHYAGGRPIKRSSDAFEARLDAVLAELVSFQTDIDGEATPL